MNKDTIERQDMLLIDDSENTRIITGAHIDFLLKLSGEPDIKILGAENPDKAIQIVQADKAMRIFLILSDIRIKSRVNGVGVLSFLCDSKKVKGINGSNPPEVAERVKKMLRILITIGSLDPDEYIKIIEAFKNNVAGGILQKKIFDIEKNRLETMMAFALALRKNPEELANILNLPFLNINDTEEQKVLNDITDVQVRETVRAFRYLSLTDFLEIIHEDLTQEELNDCLGDDERKRINVRLNALQKPLIASASRIIQGPREIRRGGWRRIG